MRTFPEECEPRRRSHPHKTCLQEAPKGDLQDEMKGPWARLQSLVKTTQGKCSGSYMASTTVLVSCYTF